MGKNTSISLSNHFERFVDDKIKSGQYNSVSEVVRDGLRMLEDESTKIEALRTAIETGERSGMIDDFDADQFLLEMKASRNG